MNYSIEHKWIWMMEWCRKNKLAPANQANWEKANEAYLMEFNLCNS